jgi:hypothetical protein
MIQYIEISKCRNNPNQNELQRNTNPTSLTHLREEMEFAITKDQDANEKKKCMAPLTLYSSNEKPTPERSRKMRGQLLWCLRGSVCASQNHLTSNWEVLQ